MINESDIKVLFIDLFCGAGGVTTGVSKDPRVKVIETTVMHKWIEAVVNTFDGSKSTAKCKWINSQYKSKQLKLELT